MIVPILALQQSIVFYFPQFVPNCQVFTSIMIRIDLHPLDLTWKFSESWKLMKGFEGERTPKASWMENKLKQLPIGN